MNLRRKRRSNALPPGAPGSPLDDWTADHPFYGSVREWVWDRLNTISDPSIFVIFGPTGAGKSTLVEDIQRQLTIRLAPAMQADPGLIPYVSAEAVYIPGNGMDWRGLFTEMLECGDEILIDRKIEVPGDTPGTVPGLYAATLKMLNFRSPALAIVDEAAAVVENTKGKPKALERNVNYLKGICNRGRTHLLLLGNYSLAELAISTAEIRRRCFFAHLPRASCSVTRSHVSGLMACRGNVCRPNEQVSLRVAKGGTCRQSGDGAQPAHTSHGLG